MKVENDWKAGNEKEECGRKNVPFLCFCPHLVAFSVLCGQTILMTAAIREIRAIRGSLHALNHGLHGLHGFPVRMAPADPSSIPP